MIETGKTVGGIEYPRFVNRRAYRAGPDDSTFGWVIHEPTAEVGEIGYAVYTDDGWGNGDHVATFGTRDEAAGLCGALALAPSVGAIAQLERVAAMIAEGRLPREMIELP